MKKYIIFFVILAVLSALPIFCFVIGAYEAGIVLVSFFFGIPLVVFVTVLLTPIYKRRKNLKPRTINDSMQLRFLGYFVIGAAGGCLLLIDGVPLKSVIMLVFGGIFAVIGFLGFTGLFINLLSYIRLLIIIKNGTETKGYYIDYVFRYETGHYRRGFRRGHQISWYAVKFKFYDGENWIEVKTNGVYKAKEAEYFAEKKEFAVKYRGDKAVITELF